MCGASSNTRLFIRKVFAYIIDKIRGGGRSSPVPAALFGVGKEEEKESDYIIKPKNFPKGGGQNHLKSF